MEARLTATYVLPDEPLPGSASRFTTSPIWCLLAVPVVGIWLAWPWFFANGLWMGSPTRKPELGWLVTGSLLAPGLVAASLVLMGADLVDGATLPYLLVAVNGVKLAVSYRIFRLQNAAFALYQRSGGTHIGGLGVVVVGFFASGFVIGDGESPIVNIIMLVLS